GLRPFECKRDVLSPHVRHAHVWRTTIDHRDVLIPEAEELEELDRSRSVRHRDGYVIGVADTVIIPPSLVDRTGRYDHRYTESDRWVQVFLGVVGPVDGRAGGSGASVAPLAHRF